MKKVFMILAVGVISMTACKKEDDNPGGNNPPSSVEEKIIGNWSGDEQVLHISFPPFIDSTSTEDISWMNAEFTSDGKIYVDSAGVDQDTSDWVLLNDDQMTIDGDTFDINTITTTNFNFGFSETEMGAQVTIEIKMVK